MARSRYGRHPEQITSTASARSGVFYGWWIALACSVITFAGTGVGVYGPSVFRAALVLLARRPVPPGEVRP